MLNKPMPMITQDHSQKMLECIKPSEDFFDHFIPGAMIGQGSICEGVHKCQCKITGEKYAVKILDKGLLNKHGSASAIVGGLRNLFGREPSGKEDSNQADRFRREVEILRKIEHPNVCQLEYFFNAKTRYFIVMELANGRELMQELNQKKKVGLQGQ